MPIVRQISGPTDVIRTVLSGTVTDEELLSYYHALVLVDIDGRWREVVDGRAITSYSITSNGQRQLAKFMAQHAERLRGGRVAMVAASEVTFGMFRMWQLQREGLDYQVEVFRELDEALAWVRIG